MFRLLTSLILFVLAACAGSLSEEKSEVPANSPPSNPYLANVYNNQGHWNDAATDATELTVPRGHYQITEDSYEIVPNDAFGIPAYTAEVAGKRIHWFFAGASMRKLEWLDGAFREIDRIDLPALSPDYRAVSPHDRLAQAREIQAILETGDELALADYLQAEPNRLLSAVEDQVSHGVLYSLFTSSHELIGSNARGLVKFGNQDPADPFSKLSQPIIRQLPDELFDNERVARLTIFPSDVVFGLSMSFNGYLVLNTIGGKIVTLDRETFEIIDVYQASGDDELFTNSFATSHELEGGAVYVASNRFMYRLIISSDGKISDDENDGAWRAAYDFGERLPYGKIADGTGATPTLMGFGNGDDELVVITDGARQMRLVAFWRNDIPSDAIAPVEALSPRIADQITITMDGADFVQSEQSVVAHDGFAFVVNGVPSAKADPYPVRGSYFRGLLLGATRPPPTGAAMYEWDADSNRWRHKWTRDDVAVLATVPFISTGSKMVIVNGYFEDRKLKLFHLGFDLENGETVMSIASGSDPLFNGTFTGVKCDHDGALMYTTMFGLVRFEVEKMNRVPVPDDWSALQ